MTEESIFTEAARRSEPDERAAFLDAACGTDQALHQRIEALLSVHESGSSFLEPLVPPLQDVCVTSLVSSSLSWRKELRMSDDDAGQHYMSGDDAGQHEDMVLRFKQKLQWGDDPKVRDLLDELCPEYRLSVLRQFILAEFDFLRDCGQRPSLADYLARFPALEEQAVVRAIFHEEIEPPTTVECASPFPRIGKYHIGDLLGRGGMGITYKASHPDLLKTVVVKIVQPHLYPNPFLMDRFKKEVLRLGQLPKHNNVVMALDAGVTTDRPARPYLVMEYIQGQDLLRLIGDRGPLPFEMACQITSQVAEGLRHFADNKLVHRDIKPSNILFNEEKSLATIVDLGLVLSVVGDSDMTMPGMTLGTADYISPEQAKEPNHVDIRADIYSLGSTLYHMLSGQAPYVGDKCAQKFINLLDQNKEPRPIEELRPGLPDGLPRALRKMMAKCPIDRYQAPFEVIDAMKPFLQQKPSPSPFDDEFSFRIGQKRPYSRRLGPWVAVMAALVILVATGGSIAMKSAKVVSTAAEGSMPIRMGSAGTWAFDEFEGELLAQDPKTFAYKLVTALPATIHPVGDVRYRLKVARNTPERVLRDIGKSLPEAPFIVAIEMSNCDGVTNGVLKELARSPYIMDIAICECQNFDDKGLAYLARSKNLRVLAIYGDDNIGGESVRKVLAGCKKLGAIGLDRTGLSPAVIQGLHKEHHGKVKLHHSLITCECSR